MTRKPIGAKCLVRWNSDGGDESVYISFGQYNEVTGHDQHGVPDDFIWGYADDLNDLNEGFKHDITVIESELVYEGDMS